MDPTPDDGRDALLARAHGMRDTLLGYFRRRITDQSEVEDLVQEVFLRVAGRSEGSTIDNFDSYLFQTASSVLTDRHRRRQVRQSDAHEEFDASRHGGLDFGPDQIVASRETLHLCVAALHRLPERTRQIFILSRLEGMRQRDIAAQLGISASAVEKHMMRAIQQMMATARAVAR